MSKIVAFTGSGRKGGTISTVINEILKGASEYDAEIKTYDIKALSIKPCQGCFYCRNNEKCSINDDMDQVFNDVKDADAVIFSSPIYMWQISGQAKQLLDRLFPLLSGTPGNYGLRYGKKKTVTVFSQGAPDKGAFKVNIDLVNQVLSFLGLEVIDTIICSGANNPKAVSENRELLSKAYDTGKELSRNSI